MVVAVTAILALGLVLSVRSAPSPPAPVPHTGDEQDRPIDPALACDLLAAALRAGASIPGALAALGEACGPSGRDLVIGARMLPLGSSWDEAFDPLAGRWALVLAPLRESWDHGIAPEGMLHAAAADVRAQRSAAAREAAERLAISLVLPLGLCLLPAFVLLGIVPAVLATGGSLLSG